MTETTRTVGRNWVPADNRWTNPRRNEISVELTEHGLFATTFDAVARYERQSKLSIARQIVDAYGGGCGSASTRSYWMRFPKTILVVVLGGLVEPTR